MLDKKLEKKKKILSAAVDCFSKTGYDKTTLDEIGSRVNLNKASLYYYYKSKEDLFSDVILFEAGIFQERTRIALHDILKLEDKVIYFLTERAGFYNKLSDMHFYPLLPTFKIDPVMNIDCNSMQLQEKLLLCEVLESGMKKGEIPLVDAGRLAEVLLRVSSVVSKEKNEKMTTGGDAAADFKRVRAEICLEDIRLISRLILRGVRSD